MISLHRWMTLLLMIALLSPLALSTASSFAALHSGPTITSAGKKEPRKPKPKPGPRDDGDGDS